MINHIRIEPLADHGEALPLLKDWFEKEWPEYYGDGGSGNAGEDLRAYSHRDVLPVGLVAFRNNELCGVAALKTDTIDGWSYLGPWAGAGLVLPGYRRHGVGAELLRGLEKIARELNHPRIYCATGTSASLLERSGWHLLERVSHQGSDIAIYEKNL